MYVRWLAVFVSHGGQLVGLFLLLFAGVLAFGVAQRGSTRHRSLAFDLEFVYRCKWVVLMAATLSSHTSYRQQKNSSAIHLVSKRWQTMNCAEQFKEGSCVPDVPHQLTAKQGTLHSEPICGL